MPKPTNAKLKKDLAKKRRLQMQAARSAKAKLEAENKMKADWERAFLPQNPENKLST
jgi:hypothetical protein